MQVFRGSLLACAFLVSSAVCLSDETKPRSQSNDTILIPKHPYSNWFVESPESLILVTDPYRLPRELPDDRWSSFGVAFCEFHLAQMFDQHARETMAGSTIKTWIEASSRFRLPEFPEAIGPAIPECVLQYDGCHVIVFDDKTPLDIESLFSSLTQHPAESATEAVRPRREQVEGHDTVAYSATHYVTNRTRRSRETPEVSNRIDAALTVRYWVTSPSKNVLLVSTSLPLFSRTLRSIREAPNVVSATPDSDSTPFSGQPHIWGVRNFQREPAQEDVSDFRRPLNLRTSGFAFAIDPGRETCELFFFQCTAESAEVIRTYISDFSGDAVEFPVTADGTVHAKINWSKQSTEPNAQVRVRLFNWLLSHIGHAVLV